VQEQRGHLPARTLRERDDVKTFYLGLADPRRESAALAASG